MADYYVQSETLTDIADAIRAKKNSSNSMAVKDMANEISSISSGINTNDATATAEDILSGETAYVKGNKVTGSFTIDNELTTQDNLIEQIQTALVDKGTPSGTNTNDATATAGDILSGKTAYVKDKKITGTIATVTQATPSISVSSSGLITASATQSVGYVAAGTKSATKQLTTQAAQTITPGTSNKTIASGRYLTGTQTIKGDSNLIAGNIKKGVSIFGVAGTHEGGEDLTTVIAEQEALIAELSTTLNNKASGGGSVEWKNIFELPTTYIAQMTAKNYYIEMPETFNILVVRVFENNNWYYNIFSIRDGINILNNNYNAGKIDLYYINDGILEITFTEINGVIEATIAEYIII